MAKRSRDGVPVDGRNSSRLSLAEHCAIAQLEGETTDVSPVMYEHCKAFGSKQSPERVFKENQKLYTFPSAFPRKDDIGFASKLNSKKEFLDNTTDLSKAGIDDVCSGERRPFSLLPYQRYLATFMSPLTPYRGVLIFHGVGTGKTSTALTIAESFKESLRLNVNPAQRRVLILALTNSIDGTFRNTLYNQVLEDMEIAHDLRPGSLHTTGNTYYADAVSDKEGRRDIARKRYESYYEIVGPDAFAKKINNMTRIVRENVPEHKTETALRRAIAREFSNRVIIVDEVHNIKDKSTEKNVSGLKAYEALRDVLRLSENVKLILMSATPMFNDPSEIINILNLLIANDKGEELKISDVFDETDTLKISKDGLKTLKEAARPYISYVRGYNPVSFPTMFEVDDKRLGGLYSHNKLYFPSSIMSIDGDMLGARHRLKHTKLIRCEMSRFQFENNLMINELSRQKANVAYKDQTNCCGIIFPIDSETGEIGTKGFEHCFVRVQKSRSGFSGIYRYQKQCRGFLRSENLGRYSSKYKKILDNILLSPGIAFVFCERIDVGVETLAMILDAHGFERDGGGHYLQDHGLSAMEMRCSVCNQQRGSKQHSGTKAHVFRQARYVVLQHQDAVTANNEIVDKLKLPGNVRGEEIKIILGSPVTKESMDFANIRQIHIASAWFNMSRVAQIIGRGVRNCSHSQLPSQERNVTVFRYCSSPPLVKYKDIPEQYYDIETGDEYMWRTSETKDIVIKKIERELKQVAFDCAVTRDGNILNDDVDGSRECDYSTCRYLCASPAPRKNAVDTTTSDLSINRNDVDMAKFSISKLFSKVTAMTFSQIQRVLQKQSRKAGAPDVVALALHDMLGDNGALPELITRPEGQTGYLIYRGTCYIFQPLSAKDRRIPLVYRTMNPTRSSDHIDITISRYGRNGNDNFMQDTNADDYIRQIMTELHAYKDVVLQDHHIDCELSTTDRVLLLEHLIEKDEKSALLVYFQNFLLVDEKQRIYGHFLSEVPRCLTSRGWHSCSLADNQKKDYILSTLYREPEASFVGYMQGRRDQKAVFKIINTLGQRDKTRLDLGTALNTLTKGKTCATYDRVILDYLAKTLKIGAKNHENKGSLCERIEYALRHKQRFDNNGQRYFLNVIETDQKNLIAVG